MKLGTLVYEKNGKSKSYNGPFVRTIHLHLGYTISKVKNCSKSKSETTFMISSSMSGIWNLGSGIWDLEFEI